jgi:hypothetical protein
MKEKLFQCGILLFILCKGEEHNFTASEIKHLFKASDGMCQKLLTTDSEMENLICFGKSYK